VLLALPQPSPSVLRAEQAITLGLSAAPAGMKDGRGQQCTTEFSRAISPQAGGERTVVSLLANKLSAMSFQGMHFSGMMPIAQ